MSDEPLVIPRRLAIQILHAAQTAQPAAIRGLVGARDGEPTRFHPEPEALASCERLWARMWSRPQAAAVPAAAELDGETTSLVVSLNTKGVLEMRAWQLVAGQVRERTLKVRD
jgi:[CysO sulfur-carrier protein]-S-L-cysteine hydrolase